jgi:uncharacterized protein YegP (UPF0339 family)
MWVWLRSLFGKSEEVRYLEAENERLRNLIRVEHQRLAEIMNAERQRDANLRDRAKGCRLEVYKDKASEFRWRLKSRNHCIIAEGGEGYKRYENLEKSLGLVIDIIGVAPFIREK